MVSLLPLNLKLPHLKARLLRVGLFLYLSAIPTGYTYRLYLSAIPIGYTYRLYLSAIPIGVIFQVLP
ncbi:hypothetical protein [uncultured Pontibacter sp.]|uniref:hypothetical protein n=1 Tax=uncultured Pontibacter sp. TaxID=453356 RepID=UPI002612D075|nr:hypothetical protein [uncultured Pontibacter sp.]